MTLTEILSDLRAKGITLWVEEKKLKYRAPQGALTAEIKLQLAKQRAEIIAFLEGETRLSAAKRPSIPAASPSSELPLSFSEEGLWLLEQLRPGVTAWNMQSTLHIRGLLNMPALESSLNTLVQRQEILRTAFRFFEKGPMRVITPELRMDLPIIDLSQSVASDDEIRRITGDDAKSPFDLAEAPLFRIKLLQLSETEHILLLTKHHIISDAWSNNLFVRELFALYEAFAKGLTPVLTDLPIQYSDYAHWVRHLNTSEMESHFSYWKHQLDGVRVVELPCDKQRSVDRSFGGSTQRIRLSVSLSRALRELCKRERATPFMVLLAAFKVLLYRYTGESDIVVGSTEAGRNKSELEHLIGMFINLLPLRTDLSGEPSFREALRRVREVCLDAYQHQDYPYEKLAQELNPARDLSRNSFFQVLFNVVNLPATPREVKGLTIEPLARPEDTARFDLTLFAPETPEGFEIIAVYNRELFASDRITEMLEQYRYLLEQVVDNSDRKIADYSMVTPSAKKWLPDPTVSLDDSWHGAVHELFARYAESQPEKLAVQDSHEGWSYKDLNNRSNQLARHLLANDIGRENIVAIYGHRSAALVSALLGVLKAGAAFCVIDPSHPAGRVQEYLSVTDPKALIQIGAAAEPNAEMEEVLKSVSLRCRITLPGAATAGDSQLLSQYPKENPDVTVGPDDLAYVIFTSGSTGNPKGVMGRHGPLTHFLPWLAATFGLSEKDRFSFIAGLATNKLQRELFTALTLGGTVCMPDPEDIGAFGKLDEWLRKEAVSIVHLTPAMAQLLEDTATQPISSARRAFFGGDLLRLRDVERVRRLMPHAEITNFYNSSETQRGGSYIVFSDQTPANAKEIPPLGRGVKDIQLLVLNRSGQLAGVGELGELCVRSPHMARGYLGDEDLTKERFTTNPFTGIESDRIYRTSEQGRYLPNGDVEFVARGQDQVSIRGFRIELGEIETALDHHPAVREAAIATFEHAPGDDRLVAYVVPRQKNTPTTSELRSFLKQKLPNYMIPSIFIFLEHLPLNPNGKVDRRALPRPERARPALEEAFVSPRTPLESLIAEVWKELLGVDRVGVYDNFFDLGGHSLLSVRAVARLKKKTGLQMSPKALVTQTVGQLAAAYEERMALSRQTVPMNFTRRLWRAIKGGHFPA